MHQHQQPRRAAGRRPVGQEGRRGRAQGQPHIDAGAGLHVVTEYLEKAGLLPYLEKLGFNVAAYGCTTCIGNAGDLTPEINEAITGNDLVAVLSGNRNFEARIHPNLKANFLASPPLVVAYAIAGTMNRDLMSEPVGRNKQGRDIWLGDIWPTSDEIHALMKHAMNGKAFRKNYGKVKSEPGKLWSRIEGVTGNVYSWPKSSYIAEPPFFRDFTMQPAALVAGVQGARVMALFGDSVTTDHISPAGSFRETIAGRQVPARTGRAGRRLQQLRLAPRQRPRDDARHLRQRAHQEPDGAWRRGWRHDPTPGGE